MSTPYDPEHITYFAETDFRNERKRFGIKSRDRTRHMYVIGKSGVGKSTLLENMAIQDIQQGEGIAVLDPHGSFAEKVLDYVPEHRIKDVIYFAPFDTDNPVSFNVLEDVGQDRRHFVASGLMSTFKKIWVDAWSARMEYILNNILLALLEYPDATLLGVNRMLADKDFRNKVVANVTDPGVKAFWVDEFAKYGERYMQEAGAAIQNKIGQFTANPLIRNIIGQPKSSFDVRKVMDEQKILIINLSKGRIGEQNTSLLGSMLITKIYLGAMSRADVSSARMGALPNYYFYVDEFQSFANETFADILAEARKYKLALIIAHQYVAQMEEKVRDAVFGNVGTTISFRVGPLDAELLEKVFSPQFTANDLINLGMAQIYLSLMINDIGSQPFSAKTLPPLLRPTITFKDDVIEHSRLTYARLKEAVETKINEWYVADTPRQEERPQKKTFPPRTDAVPRASLSSVQRSTSTPVSSMPATQQKDTPTKPFEKAFAKSRVYEPEPSSAFTAVLDAPAGAAQKKAAPHPPTPTRMTQRDTAPFDGEKPLRETFAPVKLGERGPTEKNKDLLRAALQKIERGPTAPALPHHHGAQATPTSSLPPEKSSILISDELPGTNDEIASHELQKVFE